MRAGITAKLLLRRGIGSRKEEQMHFKRRQATPAVKYSAVMQHAISLSGAARELFDDPAVACHLKDKATSKVQSALMGMFPKA